MKCVHLLRPLDKQHKLLDQGLNLPEPWQQGAGINKASPAATTTNKAFWYAHCYAQYNSFSPQSLNLFATNHHKAVAAAGRVIVWSRWPALMDLAQTRSPGRQMSLSGQLADGSDWASICRTGHSLGGALAPAAAGPVDGAATRLRLPASCAVHPKQEGHQAPQQTH